MEKLHSLHEITEWYCLNSDTQINIDFLVSIVSKKIVESKELGLYSIADFNNLLLEQKDGEFVLNDNNKFVIKENRKKLNGKTENAKNLTQKYKFTTLSGNKLKLIKLM